MGVFQVGKVGKDVKVVGETLRLGFPLSDQETVGSLGELGSWEWSRRPRLQPGSCMPQEGV